ncbi:venom protease-like [Choristoneura fumiferana]|uniref:venom protease-like n=1 Tax=Choristoneura fumiferana TaxID=7141 RepID=UPI003D1559FA
MSPLSVILLCAIVIAPVTARHVRPTHNASDILPDGYVAGGAPARVGEYPWMARLTIMNRKKRVSYMCAGSLISNRHILSAAHCFEHDIKYYTDIKIYLGEYNTDSYPEDCAGGRCTKNQVVYPDKLYSHPAYNSKTITNDIALLRLQKRASLSATIKPIPLPPFDLDMPGNDGALVYIAGWGRTEKGYHSSILMTTEVSLISKKKCLARDPHVPAGHFCAGDPNGKDTCPGDSGGPLVMYYKKKPYLSGVVSYGPDVKCGTSKAGYYINVYKYRKWIKSHM